MLFSNIVLDVVQVDAVSVERMSVRMKVKGHSLANMYAGGGNLSIHGCKI